MRFFNKLIGIQSSKSPMPTIDDIQFDTFGWTLQQHSHDVMKWAHEERDLLSIHFFPIEPDIPSDLTAISALRSFYRTMVTQAGGGIISVDVIDIKGLSLVKTIFKFPQQPTGMFYIGSLTLPCPQFSYVIKIQALELPPMGIRDAVVADKAMVASEIKIESTKPSPEIKHWFQDPYDPELKAPVLYNLSEHEQWDAQFPNHPLSRVRTYLSLIEKSLIVNDTIMHWVDIKNS